ncbi:MAG: VanW family protein, partial [Thermomicrobiales bacterium]
ERLRLLASRAAIGLAVALLTALAVMLYVRVAHAGRFYPGVTIADVPVGGMTRDQAAAALASRADSFDDSIASFSLDGKAWTAPLRDIGVTADLDAALQQAWDVGREGSAIERMRSSAGLLQSDRSVALPLSVDRTKLEAWFDIIDHDLGGKPSNASLAVNGANVTIVPERDGYLVDRQLATANVIDDLVNLLPPNEALPVAHVAASVTAADLEPVRAQLALALVTPLQVEQGGSVWNLPSDQLGRFVVQKIDPAKRGAAAFSLEMDEDALADWLDASLRPSIDKPVQDAEVGWNGEKLVSVEESQDGISLDAVGLAAAVEQSLLGAHGVVEVPVLVDKPEIDSNNLAALGITQLLATGTSNYDGSGEGRRTNLERGALLMNGTLVPPKSEFSFNNSIGYIDEDAGFVEAQVIDGEKIGKDVGGGICQVSTTVFRAAFDAGMPITEWWPHRFRIAFYEYDGWAPGLDASILQPSADPSTWDDFKFYNPTDSWLLVESYTDGARVTVNLYGPATGYQVEDDGPYIGEKVEQLADSEVVDPEL